MITRQKVYRRASGTRGAWLRFPASAAKGGIPTERLPQYVRLMLGHHASVHQASEPVQLSARLTPKDIESVDRTVGRNLRPATTIDADAWIDSKGRVVRVRQEVHYAPTSRPLTREAGVARHRLGPFPRVPERLGNGLR